MGGVVPRDLASAGVELAMSVMTAADHRIPPQYAGPLVDPAAYADGMRAAMRAVIAGDLDPDPLYTHTYPLERLDDALAATRDRPDGFMKALVVP